MLFLHESHEVAGGRMDEFGAAVRDVWRPLLEERTEARLLWYWELTHGTGPSYRAVSLAAVRDWAAWGALVDRAATDPRWRDWHALADGLRKDVVGKLLRPAPWSKLQHLDLTTVPPCPYPEPALYLHDTGWPFPGKLDGYVEALGRVLAQQEATTGMMHVAAAFTTAAGTGRRHEAVLVQRIDSWDRFTALLRHGDGHVRRGGWMEEGLHYRDRWESQLLRCADWSPWR